MINNKLVRGAVISALAYSPVINVYAATFENLKINGFLTVAAQKTNQPDTTYSPGLGIISEDQIGNSGISGDHVVVAPGSVMGLQIGYVIDDQVSITTQLVARGVSDWSQETEWAYVTYKFAPKWYLKAGRMRSPFFMTSEAQEVGFSYPWIKPPSELYHITVPSFDGVSFGRDYRLGSVVGTVSVELGTASREKGKGGVSQNVNIKNVRGVTGTMYQGSWTLFASYHSGLVMPNIIDESTDTLSQALAFISEQSGTFNYQDIRSSKDLGTNYADVGFTYDNGALLVMSEVGRLDVHDSYFPSFQGGIFTAGYRFKSILPFWSFGKTKTLEESDKIRADILEGVEITSEKFPSFAPSLEQVNVLGILTRQQTSQSLGAVFYVGRSLDFKVQVTHVYDLEGTTGLFATQPPDGTANIYGVSMDAVF